MNTLYINRRGYGANIMPLANYIRHGQPLGHFFTAVLENNLQRAVGHADSENLKNLPAFVWFLYNRAPAECHGSPEKVSKWLARWKDDPQMIFPWTLEEHMGPFIVLWKSPATSKWFANVDGLMDTELGEFLLKVDLKSAVEAKYRRCTLVCPDSPWHPCNHG